jgi:protein ImuB
VEQPRRTCALWCPDWPVVAARRADPALAGVPVVVVDASPNAGRRGKVVVSASAEARADGVAVGLRVREAEARCAGLVVLDADEAADARAFELVVRAVEQLVPRLVLERPGQLSFPTRGPSRYFGGDDALVDRIVACVRELDVADVRAGIAEGTFAAGLAARATEERGREAVVVPVGETPAFLASWPVTVLAGSVEAAFGREGGGSDLVDLLARLGLRTLGAFAELPSAAVLGRFGPPGALAHRLARGEVEHEPVATVPPDELLETIELDPPATRVDEAAFAAKMLADRMLAHLDALGLCCARVVVEAETEHGEHFSRTWRHEGALTPATLVARVRWQLDAWLLTGSVTAGITRLVLAPDDLGPAVGRQLGFWGGDPAAADRAGRALTRVPGMLGPDAVVTAIDGGGRTPTERIRWIPWGEPRDLPDSARSPWPGAVPGPAPARVYDPPVPAELLDADGAPVAVSGRGEPSAPPAGLRCPVLPDGGGPLVAWSGPWAHDLRWWDARRRRALWQVVVGGRPSGSGPSGSGPSGSGVACLVVLERGRTAVEAVYD